MFEFQGLYFNVNLILVLISVILTIIVLNFHFRGPKKQRVPKWMRIYIIGYLGRLFCFCEESRAFCLVQEECFVSPTSFARKMNTPKTTRDGESCGGGDANKDGKDTIGSASASSRVTSCLSGGGGGAENNNNMETGGPTSSSNRESVRNTSNIQDTEDYLESVPEPAYLKSSHAKKIQFK